MSESTRLGFCTDTIAGILTLDSTIQGTSTEIDSITVNNGVFTVDADGNTAVTGTLNVTGATSLRGALNVNGGVLVDTSGNTQINGTIAVSKAALLNSTLDIKGATTMSNTLDVSGYTTLDSGLTVVGPSKLNSSITVDGTTTLDDTLTVKGVTELDDMLYVVGSTTLGSSLSVTGVTMLSDDLEVAGSMDLKGNVSLTGPTRIQSSLDVSGATTLSTLAVSGPLSIVGPTTLSSLKAMTLTTDGSAMVFGPLTVAGPSQLNSLTVGGLLTSQGATTVNSTLTVASDTALNKNLNVAGSITNGGFASVGGTLDVTGAATLRDSLVVATTLVASGETSLNAGLTVGGPTAINALTVRGPTSVKNLDVVGTLTGSGAAILGSSLTVAGTSVLTGAVAMSNSLSVGTSIDISGNLTVRGAIIGQGLGTAVSGALVGSNINCNAVTTGSVTSGTASLGQLTITGGITDSGGLIAGAINLKPINPGNTTVNGALTVINGANNVPPGSITLSAFNVDSIGNMTCANITSPNNLIVDNTNIRIFHNTNITGDLVVSGVITGSFSTSSSSVSSTTTGTLNVTGSTVPAGSTVLTVTGPSVMSAVTIGALTLASDGTITNGRPSNLNGGINAGTTFLVDTIGNTVAVTGGLTLNGSTITAWPTASLDISGNSLNIGSGKVTIAQNGKTDIYGLVSAHNSLDVSGSLTLNGSTITAWPTTSYDISGTTLNIGLGKFKVDSGGNTDISATLEVFGATTLHGGFALGGQSIATTGPGQLTVGGLPINGSIPYNPDISGTTLNIGLGKLTVDSGGNTDISGTLEVFGATTLHGGLTLSSQSITTTGAGQLSVGGLAINGVVSYIPDISGNTLNIGLTKFTVDFGGNMRSVGTLSMTGLSSLNGGIDTNSGLFRVDGLGNTRVSTLDVSGQVHIGGPLDVSGLSLLNGKVHIDGPLDVSGLSLLNGKVHIGGPLDVSGLSLLNGQVHIDGPLDVSSVTLLNGQVHIGGPLDVSGLSLLNGKVHIDGPLDVSGLSLLNGKVHIGGPLDVSGLSLLNGKVHIDGPLDVSGLSYLNGGIDVNSGLFRVTESGNTTVGGTLVVNKLSSLNGGIDVSSNFSVDVAGNTHVGGTLDISGGFKINTSNVSAVSYTPGSSSTFTYNVPVACTKGFNAINNSNTSSIIFPETGILTLTGATGTNFACTTSNSTPALGITGSGTSQLLLTVGNTANPFPIDPGDGVVRIKGNVYIDGNIRTSGTLGGTTVTFNPVWSDISAAVNSELALIDRLDISAGVSGLLNAISPSQILSTTYNGYQGNYLSGSASQTDIINALNMVIATQNRIINALRYNLR